MSDFKKFTDQILGKYNSCDEKVKKTYAIILSLNKMCITDGSVSCIFYKQSNFNLGNSSVEYKIDSMIKDYRETFLPTMNNCIDKDGITSKILRPSSKHFRKHTIVYLITNGHKYLWKVNKYYNRRNTASTYAKVIKKKKSSCKFCGSTEPCERISSYKKRAELQGRSQEYILGLDDNGLQNFIQKIEYNKTFEMDSSFHHKVITIGENSKLQYFYT